MEEKNSEAAEGSDTANKLECAICLQPSVQPVQLPCRHIFCYLCVKGATQQSKRCAMCRQEIPLNYLDNPQVVADEEPTVAFEGTYQWFYEGRNGWWRYDSRTSVEIENAYKKEEPQCEVLIAGFLYIIDFEKNLQYRRSDPNRRRRIKRDLVSIPIKGIAGIRVDDNAVSSSNDNEAVCSSSSDNSSNAATQGKLAEFLKLRAEICAEIEEEEQEAQDNAPQDNKGNNSGDHCCKSKPVDSSGSGAPGATAPCGPGMVPGSPSGPMGPFMNTGMMGLPVGGCHSGWSGFSHAYGPQGLGCYGPGYSGWGCGPANGLYMRPQGPHCGQPANGGYGHACHCGGHGSMSNPTSNAPAPVIVNNFFGPPMGGPAVTSPGFSAMPSGGQTVLPPPGMGTYPQEPSNFGPARTGFCAGCNTGSNNNNVAGNCTAEGTTNNPQGTKTTSPGHLPYQR